MRKSDAEHVSTASKISNRSSMSSLVRKLVLSDLSFLKINSASGTTLSVFSVGKDGTKCEEGSSKSSMIILFAGDDDFDFFVF